MKQQPDFKLRPYQAEGVRHLLRQPFGGLLMDPGTGKTLTLLAAFHELKRRKLVDKLFVLAPKQVMYEVWPAEVKKWGFPYEVAILHGDGKRRELDRAHEECDIWCMNYGGLEWLADTVPWQYWKERRWWWAVDESTAIKHTNTRRFAMMAGNAKMGVKGIIPLFARRTVLTGTPSPNGFEDLFGQVYFCDMGKRLGRFITHYRRKFFVPMEDGHSFELRAGAEEEVWEALDGLFYRVDDSVLNLPPMHRVRHDVTMPKKARDVYDRLEADFIHRYDRGVVTAANAGVLGHKLRQACNGAVYDDGKEVLELHDAKLESIEDLVGELRGNPLLVGYEFKHDGWRLADRLGCPTIDGKTPRSESSRLLKEFNDGRLPVLAAQYVVVCRGLNLQKSCHHVAEYGQTWDLEVREQFYKRIHRSGQTKTVFLHEFVARDSADSDVHREVISGKGSKKARQDRLLKAIKERYMR